MDIRLSLKYLDSNFLGISYPKNEFYEINSEFNDNPELIESKLIELFTQLGYIAVRGSLKAKGSQIILNKKRLYGTAECTKDLSSTNCKCVLM